TVTGLPGPGGCARSAPTAASHHCRGGGAPPAPPLRDERSGRSSSTRFRRPARASAGASRAARAAGSRQTASVRETRTPPALPTSRLPRADFASSHVQPPLPEPRSAAPPSVAVQVTVSEATTAFVPSRTLGATNRKTVPALGESAAAGIRSDEIVGAGAGVTD